MDDDSTPNGPSETASPLVETVDTGDSGSPPAPDPVWVSGSASAELGRQLAARDMDGDGAAELVIGGRSDAWVLSGPWAEGHVDDLAEWSAPGGHALGLLPDLTGDGVADLAVGMGCSATVYSGAFPAGGVAAPYTAFVEPESGESFATCGDVDGDGDDDLCVGSDPNCTGPSTAALRVYALPLSPGWLGRSAALVSIEADGFDLEAGVVDLDHDGVDEIAVAAPDAADDDGVVWLVRDPPLGAFDLTRPDATFVGAADASAGSELVRGDLDGDGGDDLVIGGPYYAGAGGYYNGFSPGRAWIATNDDGGSVASLPITLVAAADGAAFANAIAVGDLDGDGADDLAISEILRLPPGPGRVAIHLGPIPIGVRTFGDAAAVLGGWGPNDYFGGSLAIGDLDGDGRDDLAVGGSGDRDGVERAGGVRLLFGPAMFP